ncbi:hypothetical protein ACSBR1_011605 [Camellia fascicularis]
MATIFSCLVLHSANPTPPPPPPPRLRTTYGPESNLTFISEVMSDPISDILSYNLQIPNQDSVQSDIRINIPFPCDCINGDFFAHVFKFTMRVDDIYETVAGKYCANLTTTEWVQKFNSYDLNRIPDGVQINVTVNCSCVDSSVSKTHLI